ncbi:hypothetical protein DL763_011319 [Monosporascus cannonballus]|nr:hypothetical protein DL763_011319 [Monosporascus cannonballus]
MAIVILWPLSCCLCELSILRLYFRARAVGIAAPLAAALSVVCVFACVVTNSMLVRPLSAYVEGTYARHGEERMNRLSAFDYVSNLVLDGVEPAVGIIAGRNPTMRPLPPRSEYSEHRTMKEGHRRPAARASRASSRLRNEMVVGRQEI